VLPWFRQEAGAGHTGITGKNCGATAAPARPLACSGPPARRTTRRRDAHLGDWTVARTASLAQVLWAGLGCPSGVRSVLL